MSISRHRYDVEGFGDADTSTVTVHTRPEQSTSSAAAALMSPLTSQQHPNSLTKLREAVSEGRRREQVQAAGSRKWFEGPIHNTIPGIPPARNYGGNTSASTTTTFNVTPAQQIANDSATGNGSYLDSANNSCLLYTSPSPRDRTRSRMPSSA